MDQYRQYLDWIDGEFNEMRFRLETWANINSWSFNPDGINRLLNLISYSALVGDKEILNLPPHRRVGSKGNIENIDLGQALHITTRLTAPVKVFLCIHSDTVYPTDNPFQTSELVSPNVLRGPGVADAKGGILVMLKALQALERSPWAKNIGWEVLINPDEEIGSVGSEIFFKEAAKRNQCGLLFEPVLQNGAMVSHRKGSRNYVVKFMGKSSHAARPELGANALVAAAYLAVKVYDFCGKLPELTTNPAKIEGGGPNNVVPDFAMLRFNTRLGNKTDLPTIHKYIQDRLLHIKKKYGVDSEIISDNVSLPKELDEKTSELMAHIDECGQSLGFKLRWEKSGGLSDGNRLSVYGLPCVDSLGVRGGKIHTKEEFIYLDSLVERAKLTALFLMKVANGEIKLNA